MGHRPNGPCQENIINCAEGKGAAEREGHTNPVHLEEGVTSHIRKFTHQEVHLINEVSDFSRLYSISPEVAELSAKSHFYAACFSSGIFFTSPV